MASSKDYLEFTLDCLSDVGDITFRQMMGEYILYYKGRIFGGIYDNRFLVKPLKAALNMIDNPIYQAPYPGGKDMILIEDMENKEFLCDLINAMYPELKK